MFMEKNKKIKQEKKEIVSKKNYADFYLKIIKAGLFLALLLPLVVLPSQLYLFQFGKVAIFRIIMEIIAVFYFLLIMAEPKYRPRWGLLELSIALFVGIYFLASFAGVNLARSVWGTVERMGGFFSFIHYWLFFIMASAVFKSREDWKKLFAVSLFVSAISSLYALGQSMYFYQYFLVWLKGINSFLYEPFLKFITKDFFIIINDWRPFGTIGNAGPFASYVLFNIFFGLYLLISKNKIFYKAATVIILAGLLGGLLVSGTRGAYLGLAGGFMAFILAQIFFSAGKKIKLFSSGILIILICLVSYVWFNKDAVWIKESYVLSRFISIFSMGDETRVWAWKSAWQGLKDKLLLGYGPENFNVAFNQYFNPLHFTGYGATTWFDRAHNVFLEILTTMGAIGLASYLSIFAALYYLLFKNRNRARDNLAAFSLIFAVPIAYFIQNMFWFDDFSTYLMLFLFFAFASGFFNGMEGLDIKFKRLEALKARISKLGGSPLLWRRLENNRTLASAILILAVAASIFYGNIKPWKFQNGLVNMAAAFSAESEDSFDWYREAMKESVYLGRYEAYKRLGEYTINTYTKKEFKTEKERQEFMKNMDFAIAELKKAVAENSNDAQFYLLLGRLYNKAYGFTRDAAYLEEGVNILKKGVELSPKRQTLLYEYGQAYVFKKDYSKAVEIFRYAKDLYPEVAISHWYLGMALSNAGDYIEAKEAVEKAIALGYDYGTGREIANIASIYVKLKDYKKAESLYLEATALEPNNAGNYVLLALTYKETGDKEKARKMAEKAILLDPSFAAEGKKFIEELR